MPFRLLSYFFCVHNVSISQLCGGAYVALTVPVSTTATMSGRFVRSSKYRCVSQNYCLYSHVFGNPAKKNVSYDNVKVCMQNLF